jgi:hypothetical protein
MNILTSRTVENNLCFLWIVWQSSLYDSSFASAFTHICLRFIISLNKFWSCTSTETDMSATVIRAACIACLSSQNISSASYNVVLCCLRDSLTHSAFISIKHLLSFCLLSKYSMKKLYCNSIKDHLICRSVSFNCHKVFQIFVICTNLKLDTLLNSASHSFKHHMMISISLS